MAEDAGSLRCKILVADDNQDACRLTQIMCTLLGHETLTAHDGPSVIEKARAWRPDIVIMDIGMPTLSGHEVCRRIRAEHWGKDMVLIALTGWDGEEDRILSLDAGFDRHLVKPLDRDGLAAIISSSRR